MPGTIVVTPWPDSVIDVLGHDPRSWYVETFWLPTLGPTAVLLLRHLADRFDRTRGGIELTVAETAAALGLGTRDGNDSPLVRTLTRLQQFDLAREAAPGSVAVRRNLPPVHRRHVRRLPAALQARHAEWVAAQHEAGPVELARRRARRVALTLLVQGEGLDTVERALHSAGFHPALSNEAARWARQQHTELTSEPAVGDDADDAPIPLFPGA